VVGIVTETAFMLARVFRGVVSVPEMTASADRFFGKLSERPLDGQTVTRLAWSLDEPRGFHVHAMGEDKIG
jgi:hypothetical protein